MADTKRIPETDLPLFAGLDPILIGERTISLRAHTVKPKASRPKIGRYTRTLGRKMDEARALDTLGQLAKIAG